MRIVIAPDSFKGTATNKEAAQYLGNGVMRALKEHGIADTADISLVPMADGGEGTAATFTGQVITLPTVNANGGLTNAEYIYDPATTTAYIDVAAASGLPAVADNLQPLTADTYGTGVLIADAQTRGATRVVLCLGGSATFDGGTGILVALGATPMDQAGLPLRQGGAALKDVANIDTAQLNIPAAAVEWVLLCDVTTSALDAAEVFGPQKGASELDIKALSNGISALVEVTGVDPQLSGMGAAGALPVSIVWLSTMLHGNADHVHLLPGAQVVAQSMGLPDLVAEADLVITGEGSFDSQSLSGKVVGHVLELAGNSTSVVVVAGALSGDLPSNAVGLELEKFNNPKANVQQALEDAGYRAIMDVIN